MNENNDKNIDVFKLKGLSGNSTTGEIIATCELLTKEETFKAEIQGTNESKIALWKYCEGEWREPKRCKIVHQGRHKSGIPINPVIIEIFEP